ncbi:hypothetical protein PHAVU_002G068100 [Phaseolus vulgaris]|uniref:thioredoxin H2-like isoform X2 n=1 Tax=Phaseolus vulgaris TaxID=3885 RepID=UPI0035C97EC2
MGGNLSSMENAHVSSNSSSHILTFHSTAKWKAHFDASKQINKLMDPVIQDFAAKYTNVEFIKIDVDELMGVSEEFQVQAMPTFILMKKGKVVDKVLGAKKEKLQKLIEKHLN